MSQLINELPNAWVVSPKDRGRKSIKNGKVFLKNNEYFEIEIFNPLQKCVLASILINGNPISKTGLIIKPGQRCYLDCFIDSREKFLFNTYEVDNNETCKEAIKNNGLVEVYFYEETVIGSYDYKTSNEKVIIKEYYPYVPYQPYSPYSPYYPYTPYSPTIYPLYTYYSDGAPNAYTNGIINTNLSNFSSDITNSYSAATYEMSSNYYSTKSFKKNNTSKNKIETGRVEGGEKSNQKFTSMSLSFEKYYISKRIIQILPDTMEPISIKKNKKRDIDVIDKIKELLKNDLITEEEFLEIASRYLEKNKK